MTWPETLVAFCAGLSEEAPISMAQLSGGAHPLVYGASAHPSAPHLCGVS